MAVKKTPKKDLIEILIEEFDEYNSKELYSMIMCGEIKVHGETIREPRCKINQDSEIRLASRKWVSRGGEKLNHALKEWDINVEGKTIVDAGSSTGGFTDCLLQNGAVKVHAVDVGYNQLDYSLRTDSRVNVLERTNIMSIDSLEPAPDFGVADLSFRSITGAASHILRITEDNLLIALVKPQFEIPETEGFDGVIRDTSLLHEVLRGTAKNLETEGVQIEAILESPIKGGKGNTEFLLRLKYLPGNCPKGNEDLVGQFISSV